MLATLAAHVASGKMPMLPVGGELVWLWFTEIRTATAMPQPIGWQDLTAYRALSGWPIRLDHCRLILAMDRAYLDGLARRADASPAGRRAPVPAAPINADVFDAMFG